MSDDNYFDIFCSNCFKNKLRTTLPLKEADNENSEPIEILSINISACNRFLGAIAGKNLVKEIEEIHQILVYEIISPKKINFVASHVFSPQYKFFSKTFHFLNTDFMDVKSGEGILLFS